MNLPAQITFMLPEVEKAAEAALKGGLPCEISGLSHVHKALITAAIALKTDRRAVIICADEGTAKKMAADIGSASGMTAALLPPRDLTLSGAAAISHEWEQRRTAALCSFMSGESRVLVASSESLLLRTLPPETLARASFTLRQGDTVNIDDICDALIRAGYSRCASTENPGQFSRRGGILDFFAPGSENPVRIEFFGDEVDVISVFDPLTQRRGDMIESAGVTPARETLPSLAAGGASALAASVAAAGRRAERAGRLKLSAVMASDAELLRETGTIPTPDRLLPFISPEEICAASYFGDALVFIDDAARVREAAVSFAKRMDSDISALVAEERIYGPNAVFYTKYDSFISSLNKQNVIVLNTFSTRESGFDFKTALSVTVKQLPAYGGSLDTALSDIRYYAGAGWKTGVACAGESRQTRMLSILADAGIEACRVSADAGLPPAGVVGVFISELSAGFEYPSLRTVVISEGQLGLETRRAQRRAKKKDSNRERIRNYADLKPGDIIVHDVHGIGRFTGITRLTVDGAERDYISLAFRGTDTLYVPATSLDVISKYIGGGEDQEVKLSKLGGTDWVRQKTRARTAAKDMAKRLIALYAERQRREGIEFIPDDDAQRAFEEGFEYDETSDQLRCAQEIKHDMQRRMPMDRLLCGDVGFGKTEVALRAIMKCVLSGYQAALLVPTTVLARQHYLTAMKRFDNTGVRVEMISRFRTATEQKAILRDVQRGQIDVLIGTHRILGKDVKFKKLGLLVVDEEQRFGVTHKEAIKEMAQDVDVLTLTATPIPRTLSMALSGIRDMSVLEEAPMDRQPVSTYVMEYDAAFINDVIRRELSRGGQVYYLHNRTESIDRVAARIQAALPEAQVGVSHGKMSQDELGEVMQRLSDGEINVLVTTTIIETGIDVPNVNTLVIENAENFGLSQLHQLRGRVGRSPRRAFAYLTYRPGRVLTEIAQKRLSAIREFAEFGSGFKIAMRDLEIRGAGNVLGAEQSGHMMSVGYDMYLRLLEEAVAEERGEKTKPRTMCSADIAVSANLPTTYVEDSGERMDLYSRIARITDEESYSDMIDELADRYGDLPPETVALLDIALMRAVASDAGITDITQKGSNIILKPKEMDLKRVSSLCSMTKYRGRLMLSAGTDPYMSLRVKPGESPIKAARTLAADYGGNTGTGE